jgi:hypothetical protein
MESPPDFPFFLVSIFLYLPDFRLNPSSFLRVCRIKSASSGSLSMLRLEPFLTAVGGT